MKTTELLWAIEPNFMREYVRLMDVNGVQAEQIEAAGGLAALFEPQKLKEILTIDGESAIINVDGPLTETGPGFFEKLFGIGGTSFALIREAAEILEDDDEIKNVTMMVDSPGGTVTGTDETYQALSSLAAKKNLEAVNTGIMASAAFWISLAANKIIASAPTAETGSIGVIIAGFDFTERLKEMGIKEVVITSKNAPKKSADLSSDAGIQVLQERLDALESVFIARVAESRSVTEKTVLRDFGKGGMLIAQDAREDESDAVSVGMIDGVIAPTGKDVMQTKKSKIGTETSKSNGGNETMTLQELLTANPVAQAEYDVAIAKAGSDGMAAGREAVEVRVKKAAPVIGSAIYPDAIKALALEVVTGAQEPAALAGAVAVYDGQKEDAAAAEAAAADESGAEDTAAANMGGEGKKDGVIKSEADLESATPEKADQGGA